MKKQRPLFALALSLFGAIILTLFQCEKKGGGPPNGGLFLPDGFEAIVVVDSLKGKARHLAVNENGDIYVKLRYPDGQYGNVALRDTDQDGRADVIRPFGAYEHDGPYGTGMRIHNGYLYFSSQRVVYRQRLKPDQLVPDSELEIIVIDDLEYDGGREHIAKPIVFDGKGHLYIPFGAPTNACQNPKRTPGVPGMDPCPLLENFAGIRRFDSEKTLQTASRVYNFATGIRSIVGLVWKPVDSQLFAVVHGRDDLFRLFSNIFSPWQNALLPSEEFIQVKDSADYGWPYCYYDHLQGKRVLGPEYGGDGTLVGRCSTYQAPLIGFPGHWAPNDLHFYWGQQFPARYRGGAFIAFHGSTNRTPYPQSGYFIGFLPFENGKPTGQWEIFADGFAGIDTIASVSDAIYRPMGIAMGPDGSLYFSDTENGRIWRVFYRDASTTFGEAQLAGMEARKSSMHIRTPDEEQDNLQKDQVAGNKVYNLYCGACHQRNGKGAAGRFPPLAGTDWVTGDKERLINLVINGLEGPIEVNGEPYNSIMPQHSFLKDEQVAEVLTYIRQNFGNSASAVTIEEVREVRGK